MRKALQNVEFSDDMSWASLVSEILFNRAGGRRMLWEKEQHVQRPWGKNMTPHLNDLSLVHPQYCHTVSLEDGTGAEVGVQRPPAATVPRAGRAQGRDVAAP